MRGVFGVGILGKLLFCGDRAACQNKHPRVMKIVWKSSEICFPAKGKGVSDTKKQ